MSFQVGDIVGDYEIVGVLGVGGMGSVYKVRNQISDRMEAMKILLPNLKDVPELADRFLREIKVQGRLEHPNITALRTAIRAGNQLLMVMEFVDGQSLDARLHCGQVSVHQATQCCLQVLNALEYAHSMGVVHRDLKPANIMITPQGAVKLTDFGIARMGGTDQKLTRTGVAMGSLYYMAPEQIQGKETDARADLYALGVTLYELVTGQRPFGGDTEFAIMYAHLEQPAVHPTSANPRVPERLGDVIMRALEKDPDLRYQNAEEFRQALLGAGATLRTAAISTRNTTSAVVTPPAGMTNRGAKPQAGASRIQPPPAATATSTGMVEVAPKASTSRWVMRGIAAGVLIVLAGGLGFVRMTSSKGDAPGATTSASTAQSTPPVQAPVTTITQSEAAAAAQRTIAASVAQGDEPPSTLARWVSKKGARDARSAESSPQSAQSQPEPSQSRAQEPPPVVAQAPVYAPQPIAQPVRAPDAPGRDPRADEWEQIKTSRDPAVLDAYRRRYPDGPFAALALRRQEQMEWEAAKASGNVQALRTFRERFAGSGFAAEAASEIDRLERDGAKAHILEALGQYRIAFENRDIGTVRSLRPGLSASQAKIIELMFREARSIEMKLTPMGDPSISGATASLQCRVAQAFVMKNGDRLPTTHSIFVQFRKSGNNWVIDSIQ